MEFQLLVNMQVASATKPFLIIRHPKTLAKCCMATLACSKNEFVEFMPNKGYKYGGKNGKIT